MSQPQAEPSPRAPQPLVIEAVLLEGTPVRHGSEEYLDSEKYEIRVRDFEGDKT